VKPDVPVVLQKLSMTLLAQIAPAVGVDYLQRNTFIAAMMLGMATEEWDRAAARRVEENAALRALFRDASTELTDAALRARLEEASRGADTDLRLGALDAANQLLRGLLIELHVAVEALDTPGARRLDAAIWTELRRSTERRTFALAPF
jgi:hypothetical protein